MEVSGMEFPKGVETILDPTVASAVKLTVKKCYSKVLEPDKKLVWDYNMRTGGNGSDLYFLSVSGYQHPRSCSAIVNLLSESLAKQVLYDSVMNSLIFKYYTTSKPSNKNPTSDRLMREAKKIVSEIQPKSGISVPVVDLPKKIRESITNIACRFFVTHNCKKSMNILILEIHFKEGEINSATVLFTGLSEPIDIMTLNQESSEFKPVLSFMEKGFVFQIPNPSKKRKELEDREERE